MSTEKVDQKVLNKYMGEVQQAHDGEMDVFDVATRLNELKKSISELYDELKDEIMEERGKYGDKEEITRNGYRIDIRGRKYWKYDHDAQYAMIKEELKHREKLMKRAANQGEPLENPQTGEVVEPAKFSESSWPVLKFVGNDQGILNSRN